MPSSITGLRGESEYSPRSRHFRKESPRRDPRLQWNNRDARGSMEDLLNGMSPVALEALHTRSYIPTWQESAFLDGLFGKPNCVSPWRWKGISFIFFLFVFLIIIAAIFCCGPAFFGSESWLLWSFIGILSVILLIGALYSSAKIEQMGVTCQI